MEWNGWGESTGDPKRLCLLFSKSIAHQIFAFTAAKMYTSQILISLFNDFRDFTRFHGIHQFELAGSVLAPTHRLRIILSVLSKSGVTLKSTLIILLDLNTILYFHRPLRRKYSRHHRRHRHRTSYTIRSHLHHRIARIHYRFFPCRRNASPNLSLSPSLSMVMNCSLAVWNYQDFINCFHFFPFTCSQCSHSPKGGNYFYFQLLLRRRYVMPSIERYSCRFVRHHFRLFHFFPHITFRPLSASPTLQYTSVVGRSRNLRAIAE